MFAIYGLCRNVVWLSGSLPAGHNDHEDCHVTLGCVLANHLLPHVSVSIDESASESTSQNNV